MQHTVQFENIWTKETYTYRKQNQKQPGVAESEDIEFQWINEGLKQQREDELLGYLNSGERQTA